MTQKIKGLISSFRANWKTPPQGRYMPYKEIASLATGGIGVKFVQYVIQLMLLSVGNTLIGNTIGIPPGNIYAIYIISVISSFPLTAIRAKMIDNTRSMKGKYRPYIVTMGIPSAILGSLFMAMPYEKMSTFTACVVVLIFNIGFQFFYNFYYDAYDSLINVLSPNSIERSDVLSIKSIVENLAPSIVNIALPILAKLITGENNLYNMRIYRIIFPPMAIGGFLLSLLVYVNTEEKIVQSKTHVVELKFIDAFRAIARNKYFWIISLAGWLGFLENSFANIIGWMYSYQNACSPAQYSLITAIAGNASFWPNIVAPFFIRKYGKKKILVATNLINIVLIASMLPVVRMTGSPHIIWFLLMCTFANNFITSLGSLLNPSIQADIRDYQQYVTGERIDGMFAAVGLIGSAITLATSSVLPAIYEKAGLNTTVAASLGVDNVYDVLFNTDYFVSISTILVMASIVGAVMNVLPFFFYNLTENDQRGMVAVLKLRAMFEDYSTGTLSDEALAEGVSIINEAREYSGMELTFADKTAVKAAKGREAKKAARANARQTRETNDKILVARRVMDELTKYDTEQGKADIETARRFIEAGIDGFESVKLPHKAEAKALPAETEREKEIRRNTLIQIQSVATARKAKAKYYPDGIEMFDDTVFEKLFKAEDNNEQELAAVLAQVKSAKESKDNAKVKALKEDVKALQNVRKQISAEIKKATEQNSIYHRAAKPYLDAVKTLKQAEDYSRLDDIVALCK